MDAFVDFGEVAKEKNDIQDVEQFRTIFSNIKL